MAKIIDFDFYRKFRLVLPIRSSAAAKQKDPEESSQTVKPCRRKRKTNPLSPTQKKK